MKCFIVLSALVAVALAKPGYLLDPSHHVSSVVPLAYAKLVPGAPLGADGRVVETLEVAQARFAHEAAHAHEKIALEQESLKSADLLTYAAAPAPVATAYLANSYASLPVAVSSYQAVAPAVTYTKYVPAAPLGHDGTVVDTAEVRQAKAAHKAAHDQEKIALAKESLKSADLLTYVAAPAPVATAYLSKSYASLPVAVSSYQAVAPAVTYVKHVPAAPLGHDGNVIETPEVMHARNEHLAAHARATAEAHDEPNVQLVSAYSVGSYQPRYASAQLW